LTGECTANGKMSRYYIVELTDDQQAQGGG
jgi:hypothetical protein